MKIASLGTSVVSLDAVAATGAGDSVYFTGGVGGSRIGVSSFSWQTVFSGTPTAITVNLEGSIDGTNWYTLDTSTSTAGEMRHVVNKPVLYLRCNIAAYTVNSSTATCSVFAAGQ